jgi:hypothetical protein
VFIIITIIILKKLAATDLNILIILILSFIKIEWHNGIDVLFS